MRPKDRWRETSLFPAYMEKTSDKRMPALKTRRTQTSSGPH